MVEGAALEKQYVGNDIEGSNPSLSARREGARYLCLAFSLLVSEKIRTLVRSQVTLAGACTEKVTQGVVKRSSLSLQTLTFSYF